MSASVTLQRSKSRSSSMTSSLTQYSALIVCVFFLLSAFALVFKDDDSTTQESAASASTAEVLESPSVVDSINTRKKPQATNATSDSSVQLAGILEYVKRRYRVSPDAVLPVFEVAEMIGRERRIDPLLILAIIGVESGFNPFAESSMGARGLMQIIPRFHMDKVPSGTAGHQWFDPALNIRVGVGVLEEAIRRRGGLSAALQYYAGSSDTEGSYANKVLAEKARLEKAARRMVESST